jgi:hypothetical protein
MHEHQLRPHHDAFTDLVEGDLRKENSGLSADIVSTALKAVSRFKRTGIELEVPAELAKEIAKGNLFRNGAVVRDSAGKIRGFLQDPKKAGKLLKGPALAFAVIDIAQTVLLNEKLQEIQDQLRSIEDKVDALIHSKLQSAFVEASQISFLKIPAERNRRVHSALDSIKEALPLLSKTIQSTADTLGEEAKKASPKERSFLRSRSKHREKAISAGRKLTAEVRLFIMLLALRAKLFDELKEYEAAAQTRTELTAVSLFWSEHLETTLGHGSQIRPISAGTTFFDRLNFMSLEGRNYEKATAEQCEAILAQNRHHVRLCITDHALTRAIAQQPLPKYFDE